MVVYAKIPMLQQQPAFQRRRIAAGNKNDMKGLSEHWGVTGSWFVKVRVSFKGRQKNPCGPEGRSTAAKSKSGGRRPCPHLCSRSHGPLPSPPLGWSSSDHTQPLRAAELSETRSLLGWIRSRSSSGSDHAMISACGRQE